MNDRQKRWFIYLEIEGRKSRPNAPAVPKPRTPYQHKTSTPIRKSVKPGAFNTKKRFKSGSRKV